MSHKVADYRSDCPPNKFDPPLKYNTESHRSRRLVGHFGDVKNDLIARSPNPAATHLMPATFSARNRTIRDDI